MVETGLMFQKSNRSKGRKNKLNLMTREYKSHWRDAFPSTTDDYTKYVTHTYTNKQTNEPVILNFFLVGSLLNIRNITDI